MTTAPRRITFEDLRKIASGLPAEMREDVGGRVIGVANSVIAHFLGREWLEKHVHHNAAKPGFMRLDFSTDRRREATVFRVVDLAENLFNLQTIEGFDACVAQMAQGAEKIESTYAELEFGRFLYIHDVKFRFIVPQNKKGADFDFEISYSDGRSVPADAKCKFESTTINPESVRNSLKKARTQLPQDCPGIIFIKVPQAWVSDPATAISLIQVARKFLTTTKRIASIKFYVSQLKLANEMVMHLHQYNEITNDNCRFHRGLQWDLFSDHQVPASWNGMPSKWIRIFNFPAEDEIK